VEPAEAGATSVIVVDTLQNLLIASRHYDGQGQLLNSFFPIYAEAPQLQLVGFQQQSYQLLPSGKTAVMETHGEFAALEVTFY
jgi:hypothetical protein